MRHFRARGAIAGLILATLGSGIQAQANSEDCADIASDQERLACYDRLHSGTAVPPADPRPGPQAPTPREDAPRPEAAPRAPAPPPAARRDPPPAEPPEAQDTVAKVAATGEGITGRTWFRLESGELWEQMSPGRTTIGRGDTVRINRSPIGTHHMRLEDGSSRSTQVRRLE